MQPAAPPLYWDTTGYSWLYKSKEDGYHSFLWLGVFLVEFSPFSAQKFANFWLGLMSRNDLVLAQQSGCHFKKHAILRVECTDLGQGKNRILV